MIALIFSTALSACSPCVIQNVTVEVGDGTTIPHASVTVSGGRITQLGGAVPAGATVIDGHDGILTPGLIEARSGLGVTEVDLERDANDGWTQQAPFTPAFAVAWGFNPASVWIPIAREEGLTSAVIVPHGGVIDGTGSWVDLTGALSSIPDPLKPLALFGAVDAGRAERVGGARGALWLALRQVFADARFYKQNKAAFEKGDARTLSLSTLNLEALQPVLDGTIPFVIDANRASDILAALAFAKEEKLRIVISGGAESWMVAADLAREKVPVLVRPSVQLPASFDQLAARDDVATLLNLARVPLVISTAENGLQSRRLRQEAGIAVANGLSHASAIRAITLGPAEAFGKAADYGSVTVGKRANLVLWSGDPLETSSFVQHLWIDGVEQSLETRQQQLVKRYRTPK